MSSLALRDLQASFWRALHHGSVAPALAGVVRPSPTLDPTARIGIYQDMYVWRLYEVLREDYPRLTQALGDRALAALARRYVFAHPSEHPSVRHFGQHLPSFLAQDALSAPRPWLAALAALELARTNAFDAADAPALRATDLTTVAPHEWPRLRFTVAPSVAFVDAAWPIHDVWADPTTKPPARPTRLRVWRDGFAVFHSAMDAIEADALDAVVAGAPFAAVCDAVAAHMEPTAAPAITGGLLARWLEDGVLVDVARD